MFGKKDCVYIVLLIYTALLISYALLRDDRPLTSRFNSYSYENAGVRFCCENAHSCNEKFIRDNFKERLYGYQYRPQLFGDRHEFKILYEKPACKEMEEVKDEWNFELFGGIGNIEVGDHIYRHDQSCLQDVSNGTSVEWKLHVCKTNAAVKQTIQRFATVISVSLLFVVFVIHVYFKELRSSFGKCSMLFVLGLMLSYAALPFCNQGIMLIRFLGLATLCVGFSFSFMWISAMVFDIWWTFKQFRTSNVEESRFKFYCIYAFGLTFVMLSAMAGTYFRIGFIDKFAERITLFFLLCYFLTAIVDLILLALTAIAVLRISRNTNVSEYTKFKQDKERFWICVEIFAVMLLTWPTEIDSYSLFESFESKIILELIKLFSAFVIFLILVSKKDVQAVLANRYQTFNNRN